MRADRQADDAAYRPLQKWEDLAERRIRAAQEDGLFDDLPGSGQPLTLDDNPFAGERAIGFGLLKNAGFAPEWIELDKEIRAEIEALRELRERAARRVAELVEADMAERPPRDAGTCSLRRWFGRKPARPGESPRRARAKGAMAEREHARAAYLDRASRLSERITLFNAVRPLDLWWLERPLPTADRHASDFDAACPPVVIEDEPANRHG